MRKLIIYIIDLFTPKTSVVNGNYFRKWHGYKRVLDYVHCEKCGHPDLLNCYCKGEGK